MFCFVFGLSWPSPRRLSFSQFLPRLIEAVMKSNKFPAASLPPAVRSLRSTPVQPHAGPATHPFEIEPCLHNETRHFRCVCNLEDQLAATRMLHRATLFFITHHFIAVRGAERCWRNAFLVPRAILLPTAALINTPCGR